MPRILSNKAVSSATHIAGTQYPPVKFHLLKERKGLAQ